MTIQLKLNFSYHAWEINEWLYMNFTCILKHDISSQSFLRQFKISWGFFVLQGVKGTGLYVLWAPRDGFAILSLLLFPNILTCDELVDTLPVQELRSLEPQLELPQRPLRWITGMNHVPGNGRHVINVNFNQQLSRTCNPHVIYTE